MNLVFAGTRGGIVIRSQSHYMHSSLVVEHQGHSLLVDCGEDWLGRLDRLARAEAVVITHAHPDHAGGLKNGWERPVWATREAWQSMAAFPLRERKLLEPREGYEIAGIRVTALPLEHSERAPAVGLHIAAGGVSIFYAPDVLFVPDAGAALQGIDLYVGDGASLKRGVIRKAERGLVGHAPIRAQLGWCAAAAVRKACFTHCGSPIVRDPVRADRILQELAQETGVEARLAYDGMELTIGG